MHYCILTTIQNYFSESKKLMANTENMKQKTSHNDIIITVIELSLMSQMAVKARKIYFKCKKKVAAHVST